MPRHTHECRKLDSEPQTEIGLICLLKHGKPAGSTVTFVVYHDGVEVTRLAGSVVTDARARAGKAATVKYTPPLVADDKTHYVITYMAIADGEEYKTDDEIHIWPRKAKLNSRNEDDAKPLKDFKFKITQNGSQYGSNQVSEGDDPSTLEFKLDKGAPFVLEAIDPYEFIEAPAPQGGKLRDLKSKGRLNFVPEFVNPKRPGSGEIQQWVNLDGDPAQKGCDGLGHEVEVTVGVLGDRDAASGTTIAKPLGASGIYVYLHLIFSGPDNTKSKRSTPPTALMAGLNLIECTPSANAATDAQWEFKGKVDLTEVDGVGKFKLNLGQAGLDSCLVKLGSTPACSGPTLKFINWRKRWYELMAPAFMSLGTSATGGGDFLPAGLASIKTAGDSTGVDYEIFKSFSFSLDEARLRCKGSVLDREFLGCTSGPAQRFILTRYTMPSPPTPFDGGKGSRAIQILLCDDIFVNDGTDKHPDRDFTYSVETAAADCVFPNVYWNWTPVSANLGRAGIDSVQEISWTADIDNPDDFEGPVDVVFEADVDDPDIDGSSKDRQFRLSELTQTPADCTLVFKNPLIGHTATSLDASAKQLIKAWLAGLWDDAQVRPHGFALKIRITGSRGTAADTRRAERFQAIRDFIDSEVSTHAPLLYKHLGLESDGMPRTGILDWNLVKNMPRSRTNRIGIDLPSVNPDDPGLLAGPLSASHCPIEMYVKWEDQGRINGNANNPWVVVKIGLDAPAPQCVSETFLHENAHRLGMAKPAHGVPGLPAAKKSDEADPVFAFNGTLGHFYTGKGHSGGHCAYGISDAIKGGDRYHDGRDSATCILYGQGGRDDASRRRTGFCPQCQGIMRGLPLK